MNEQTPEQLRQKAERWLDFVTVHPHPLTKSAARHVAGLLVQLQAAEDRIARVQRAAESVLREVECNDWQRHEDGPCDACVALKLLREAVAKDGLPLVRGSLGIPTARHPNGERAADPKASSDV